MRRRGLLLLLAVLAVYANSLHGGFHYDDEHALVRNPHLRRLSAIPSYFVDASTFSAEPAMAMYRPLLQVTYALNYAAGGYDPVGWHLVNVLAHGSASLAVLVLAGALVGPGAGWLAAALFALHPVHTQAVDYLSSRSEVLCMALVLWALVQLHVRRRTWAGSALYAASLLTKSAAVTLVPVAVLLELWRPAGQRRWRWLLPVGGLSLAYLAGIQVEGFLPRSLAQDVRPFGQQIWTQTKALGVYAKLAAFPHPLSVEHDLSVAASPWAAPVWLAGALTLSLLVLCARGLWRRRGLETVALGGLWFLAGLGLTFVVPLNVLVNEHRLYLPVAGLSLSVAALGIGPGVARYRPWRQRPGEGGTAGWGLGPAGVAAVCALLGIGVWQQNRLWDNELTLWSAAVVKAPGSARAWGNYGLALQDAGRREAAAAAYRKALELNPDQARTWNNLGLLREAAGDRAGALQAFRTAVARSATFSGALANLGRLYLEAGDLERADEAITAALARNPLDVNALVHAGRLAQRRGDTATARARYEAALDLDPASAPAANNLGLLLWEAGDLAGARAWLQRAVDADPDHEAAAINLASLEAARAGVDRETAYRQLLAAHPGRTEVVLALGRLLGRADRWPEAVDLYQQALRRRAAAGGPGTHEQRVPELYVALGTALAKTGDAAAARQRFRTALRQRPDDPRALAGLAAAAAALGDLEEALAATRRLLRLDPGDRRARANLERLEAAGGKAPEGPGSVRANRR